MGNFYLDILDILTIVALAIIIKSFCNLTIAIMHKTGFEEFLQVHGSKLIRKWANCDFCKRFWICTGIGFILSVIFMDFMFIFASVIAIEYTK